MILHHEGFPIRKSVGQSLFAAHHSLSQLVTSFIGSWCQGIHLTLLFAWTSCILFLYFGSLWIVWVSLNIYSFRIIDSLTHEKTFFAFCTCYLSCAFAPRLRAFHLAVKLYAHFRVPFPFRLERLIYLLRLFVLFCSFSTQKYFLLFDCQRSFGILMDPRKFCVSKILPNSL